MNYSNIPVTLIILYRIRVSGLSAQFIFCYKYFSHICHVHLIIYASVYNKYVFISDHCVTQKLFPFLNIFT
jgi:hypothetical protein